MTLYGWRIVAAAFVRRPRHGDRVRALPRHGGDAAARRPEGWPPARDLDHDAGTGAWLGSALGAGAVDGRLVMGAVSDRIGRRPAIVAAMAIQALAFVGFATPHGLAALVTAVLVGFLFALAGSPWGSVAAWGPLALLGLARAPVG